MQTGCEDYFDYVEQGMFDDLARERALQEERFYEFTGSDIGQDGGTTPDAAVRPAWDWEVNLGGILAQGDCAGD